MSELKLSDLDLGHLALFLGLRVNQLVLSHLTHAGFRDLRESHGYLIQHLIESERTITELAERLAISQQAASKAVAELINLGILEQTRGADRRSKMIRLSARGWEAVHRSRRVREAICRKLERALGSVACERTKRSLISALNVIGGAESIRTRRVKQLD